MERSMASRRRYSQLLANSSALMTEADAKASARALEPGARSQSEPLRGSRSATWPKSDVRSAS
jgi:hypothetical protein